jgi:hypothetical protein
VTNSVSSFATQNIMGMNPADPHGAWSPMGQGGPPNIQNTKICCGFIWNAFHSSDKKQYLGPLLGHLRVTLLIIIGGPRLLSSGGPRHVIYATVLMQKQAIGYDPERVPFTSHNHNAISEYQF